MTPSPTIAVLEAVATREDTAIIDLPPLGNQIHPDALDQLFAPKFDGTPRGGGYVRFTYAGYHVTVWSDATVELEKIE